MDETTPWVAPAVTNLRNYVNKTQYDAIVSGDVNAGETETSMFTEFMVTVTGRIISKLQARQVTMSSATANAIPPECMWIACYLILEMFNSRITSLNLSEDQKNLIKKAEKDLDNFAIGKQLPSAPPDPVNQVQTLGATQVVTRGPRNFNPWSLRGI